MVARRVRRTVVAALATTGALVLGAGCTPDSPAPDPHDGTPPTVDPLPEGMADHVGHYFAFAVPEHWERCPGDHCRGMRSATVWVHGDNRLVVPPVSSGWACPDEDAESTMAMNSDASKYLPDAYDADGERSLRVDAPIVDSRALDVPRAQGAWQHEIVDRDGVRHLVDKVYYTGKVLTMYFLYMDDETVARITDTVATATVQDPWTPDQDDCS